MVSGESKVKGTVTFSQTFVGGPVTVRGHIEGIEPDSRRGFHVQ
jgi:Cu-Zn family superoxide dismutase